MDVQQALVLTGVVIFCGGALGFFFSDNDERWLGALIGLAATFNISWVIWLIYVIAHFVTKYW